MTIPVGYAQVAVRYEGVEAPTGAENIFGVELVAVGLDPSQVALSVASIWNVRVRPNLTNSITITQVRVKFGPDDTGPSTELGITQVGGNAAAPMPPNVSLLATKTTALGGRRGRGRMFIPGLAEADADGSGNLAAGTVTAWNTALAGILADLDVAGIPMVLLHEPATIWTLDSNGQPRRVPVVGVVPSPDLVTGLTIAAKVATQRRRNRR